MKTSAPLTALCLALAWLGALRAISATPESNSVPTVLVIVGAPGEAEYATNFVQQASRWTAVCQRAETRCVTFGLDAAGPTTTNDWQQLEHVLAAEPKEGSAELWLVLIGHGTYDGKEAKFSLRGPDLSATTLAQWLKPFRRPVAVVDTSSASAPFLNALSGTNRVVITATRTGNEQSFAYFGQHLAAAIADPAGDLDQDGQTSLLEAFLSASARVAEFYQTEGRLATEHALLDDNGDGLGTPADWFRGTRATKKAKEGRSLDGLRAHPWHLVRSPEERRMSPAARAKRDELELDIARLRESRPANPGDDYYHRLETVLRELAALYEEIPKAPAAEKIP